jgi:hypothetical protein
MPDSDPLGAPTRARIQALAALGVPADDIRQLHGWQSDGTLLALSDFKAACARELGVGYAQANIEVSKVLFTHASDGEHAGTTLAWAKQNLGWGEKPTEAPNEHQLATSAAALAALQQLLDQLAASKAGRAADAPELANGSTPGAVTAP